MTLDHLNKWIKQHGFKTNVHKASIDVYIPFTTANGAVGEVIESVTNIKEAREALGY